MLCKNCPVKDPDHCRLWGWKESTGCSDVAVDWEYRAMAEKQRREKYLSKSDMNRKVRARKVLEAIRREGV